jgi:hypothetical protein
MFNQLFFRSDALIRQLSAPLVDERRQYLAECASQGMSRRSLRAKSLLLLSIVVIIRLSRFVVRETSFDFVHCGHKLRLNFHP